MKFGIRIKDQEQARMQHDPLLLIVEADIKEEAELLANDSSELPFWFKNAIVATPYSEEEERIRRLFYHSCRILPPENGCQDDSCDAKHCPCCNGHKIGWKLEGRCSACDTICP